MRWHILLSSSVLLAVPLVAIGRGPTSVSAMGARAGNSPWTGTFTIAMYEDVTSVPGAGSSDHIKASCVATITRHADGTASATAIYSYDETKIEGNAQAGNQVTVRTHVPRTVASYPAYTSVPSFDLDGQGGYRVDVETPSIQTLETETTTIQGSTPRTQKYGSQAACDPDGGEEAQGRLPGGGTIEGVQTHTLLNGVKIIFRWMIEDSTLGPPRPQPHPYTPNGSNPVCGTINVTASGIATTLSWHGWEICYAGDWRASRGRSGGAPTIISSDGSVQITIQVVSAATSASAQGTIAQIGAAAGGIQSITFRPFVAGRLKGQLGIMTLAGSHNTLLIVVISEGASEVIMETLIRPGYAPLDLVEAGMAMASIQPVA